MTVAGKDHWKDSSILLPVVDKWVSGAQRSIIAGKGHSWEREGRQ